MSAETEVKALEILKQLAASAQALVDLGYDHEAWAARGLIDSLQDGLTSWSGPEDNITPQVPRPMLDAYRAGCEVTETLWSDAYRAYAAYLDSHQDHDGWTPKRFEVWVEEDYDGEEV